MPRMLLNLMRGKGLEKKQNLENDGILIPFPGRKPWWRMGGHKTLGKSEDLEE